METDFYGTTWEQTLSAEVRSFLALLSAPNYPWFAQFFETQLLQSCVLHQYGEIDPALKGLANVDKLRKLQQRFIAQRSSGARKLPQNERVFFKFLEVANNYALNMQLIVTLSSKLISMSAEYSQYSMASSKGHFHCGKVVVQLKTLGKCLGFLLFFPKGPEYFFNTGANAVLVNEYVK